MWQKKVQLANFDKASLRVISQAMWKEWGLWKEWGRVFTFHILRFVFTSSKSIS